MRTITKYILGTILMVEVITMGYTFTSCRHELAIMIGIIIIVFSIGTLLSMAVVSLLEE